MRLWWWVTVILRAQLYHYKSWTKSWIKTTIAILLLCLFQVFEFTFFYFVSWQRNRRHRTVTRLLTWIGERQTVKLRCVLAAASDETDRTDQMTDSLTVCTMSINSRRSGSPKERKRRSPEAVLIVIGRQPVRPATTRGAVVCDVMVIFLCLKVRQYGTHGK